MRERAVAQRMATVAAVLASMVGLTVAVGALTKSKVGGLAMVLGGIMTYGLMLLLEQVATSIGHLVANVPPISDNVIGILTTMGLALLAIAGWGTLAGLAGAIGRLLAGLTVQNIRLFERALEFFLNKGVENDRRI